MGSPGVFIHSGTLGGRLAVFSFAARALLPARPPAMTAPPNRAPLSLRNRRRDAAKFLPLSVGLVILVLRAKIGLPGITRRSSAQSQRQATLMVIAKSRRCLPRIAAPYPILPVQRVGRIRDKSGGANQRSRPPG